MKSPRESYMDEERKERRQRLSYLFTCRTNREGEPWTKTDVNDRKNERER
jgi:hypothetical protein